MCRSRTPLSGFIVSIVLLSVSVSPVFADERISLPGTGELTVDSVETRKRLLTVELALTRELIEMVRSRLAPDFEPPALQGAAVLAIQRMHDAYHLLEQLDSTITSPAWLRQKDLSLQVLVRAQAVEEAQDSLKQKTMYPAAVQLVPRLKLLEAITLLVPRQLELAKASGVDSAERERIAHQSVEVERRAKSLSSRFEKAVDDGQIEPITTLSVEAHQLLDEADPLVNAAWDLCKDQFPGKRDTWAILSHIDAIRARTDDVIAAIDAATAEAAPSDVSTAKLWSLQIKKLAILRERRLTMDMEGRIGRVVAFGDYWRTVDSCFNAELDLCTTSGERIARCRQHIRTLQDALNLAEAEYRAGARSGSEVDEIKIRLLDAEIFLERQQSLDDRK